MDAIKVMIVEDERVIARDIKNSMEDMGYSVISMVASGEKAVDDANLKSPDIVLMDISLQNKMDGIEAAEQIYTRFNIPVIFLTAYANRELFERARAVGSFGYLIKPFEEHELNATIEMALYKAKMEAKLMESEERYRTVANFTYDWEEWILPDGNYCYVSPSCQRITGYSQKEFMERPELRLDIIHPEDREIVARHQREHLVCDAEPGDIDFRIISRNEKERWIGHWCQPVYSEDGRWLGLRTSNRDITRRKRTEEKIAASLREKEVLLREIHHRVKNNMQVITSLLNLQAGKIKNKKMITVFKESQNRIKVMILIHEMLYQSRDLSQIEFQQYAGNLVKKLLQVYRNKSNLINCTIDAHDLYLIIDDLVPLGLILNELLTNAFKYAFPDKRRGEISITLKRIEENELELIVSDNGVGLPKNIDIREIETLGLQLVWSLVEKQLGGSIKIGRDRGTQFTLRFKPTV